MNDWVVVKPPAVLTRLPISAQDCKEADVLLLEDAIARFYTDTFFCFFGRAATVPARIS